MDYYPTPGWCVRRLLEEVELPGGEWLEPCAGDGAIIRAVQEIRDDVSWRAMELRESCRPDLVAAVGGPSRVQIGNALAAPWPARPVVALTNPPFREAMPFVEVALERADTVAVLLRLNFLASAVRAPLMRRWPPDVYVLPNRPSFTGGGTDSTEYAWFVWRHKRDRTEGRIKVLATTPRQDRRVRRDK